MSKALIAIGQMTSSSCHSSNYSQCRILALDARKMGACLLFLPECFNFIGKHYTETLQQAESLEGPFMQRYRDLAKETGLWLSLGGFHEKSDVKKTFNTHVILDSQGKTKAVYRKTHLFDVDISSGPTLRESSYTERGSEHCIAVDTPAGRLGLSICYDLRFPEVYTELVEKEKCDILCAPSAFTVPTGKAHWEVLIRARAIETQCYFVAAAQVGTHNEKRKSYGHSIVVDPWGKILCDAGGEESPKLIYAEICQDKIATVRENMPISKHRAQANHNK
eukprot:g510.t1